MLSFAMFQLSHCYYRFYFFFPLDTHALVKFLEEDSTAIVPVSRIEKKETLEFNGSCSVRWSNRKIYKGFLLMSGM